MTSLRFGLVAGRPASGTAWTTLARRAESLGYDLLLAPDSAFTPSPFPALAAAAAVTTRLRVGTWVLAAPLRTPAAVARESEALQLLSGGRFELGIGTGRPDAEREAGRLGAPWGTARQRLERLIAAIAAVRDEVDPAPEVTVAASGPRALAAAGRVADTVALALAPSTTVDEVRAAADRARAAGSPALALQVSAVAGRWVSYVTRQGPPPDGGAAFLRGDPGDMAGQLRALSAATGVTTFPIAEEHLEAFAPVLPLLR